MKENLKQKIYLLLEASKDQKRSEEILSDIEEVCATISLLESFEGSFDMCDFKRLEVLVKMLPKGAYQHENLLKSTLKKLKTHKCFERCETISKGLIRLVHSGGAYTTLLMDSMSPLGSERYGNYLVSLKTENKNADDSMYKQLSGAGYLSAVQGAWCSYKDQDLKAAKPSGEGVYYRLDGEWLLIVSIIKI